MAPARSAGCKRRSFPRLIWMRFPSQRLTRLEKVYAGTQRMAFELLRIPLFTFVLRRVKLLAHVPEIRFACSTFQHSIVATWPRRFFPADFQEAALDRRTKQYICGYCVSTCCAFTSLVDWRAFVYLHSDQLSGSASAFDPGP